MKKQLFLLLFLILFAVLVTIVLIYRARINDGIVGYQYEIRPGDSNY